MNTIADNLREIVKARTKTKEEYNTVCEEITKHFEGWKPLIQDLHPKAQQCIIEWEEQEKQYE